jgi:hypothetical protein
VSQTSYSDKIKEYLQAAKNANTHPGKLIAFSDLLKGVFGVSSYEVVQNVEQYIKSGRLLVLKGRMDLRLGQTIMEFKLDLGKELEDAVEEIERYTTILRKNGKCKRSMWETSRAIIKSRARIRYIQCLNSVALLCQFLV